MKKVLALVTVVCFLASLAGCEKEKEKEKTESKPAKRPPSKERVTEVRPAASDGATLLAVFDSIEENLDRLAGQAELLKRKPALDRSKTYEFDTSGAPRLGSADAKVKAVVFTDFECPGCARFASTMEKIVKKRPDLVSLTVMNFPLHKDCNPLISTRMHPRACFLAELAMAAKEQGKYWTMHDYIFQNPSRVRSDKIDEFARQHGMDGEKLLEAVRQEKYKSEIQDQARQLMKTKKRGTPAVFINGMAVIKPAWHDLDKTENFITELVSPEKEPELAKVIKDPSSLPEADVVLEDGTLLQDRLVRIREKIEKIKISGKGGSRHRSIESIPRDLERKYPFRTEGRPCLGPEDAPLTVVAFLDLLSAHTERLLPVLKSVHEKYPEKVKIVFKFMPRARRDLAGKVHVAALEAWRQDSFWKVADKIVESRRELTEEKLREIIVESGMDVKAYDKVLEEDDAKKPLVHDLQDARHARVERTPAVFVEGKFLPEVNQESVLEAIEENLKGGN